MKQKLLILIFALLLGTQTTPSSAQMGTPTTGDILIAAAIGAVEIITSDAFTNSVALLKGMDETVKFAKDAIKTTTAILEIYKNSKELLEMTDVMMRTLTLYYEGVAELARYSLILESDEVLYYVLLLDFATFQIPATATDRSRKFENIGNGILKIFPDMEEASKTGGKLTLKEINDIVKDTRKTVNKVYSRTNAVYYEISGFIRKRQRDLGLYTDIFKSKSFQQSMKEQMRKF